jgi:hypothetical protein
VLKTDARALDLPSACVATQLPDEFGTLRETGRA